MRGLSNQYGAPVDVLRGATRQALGRLVALAKEEAVAFVVIAGDVFDGDWQDYRTGLFFNQAMAELNEAGISVFLAYGNHDAQSVISRRLRLPPNVHTFRVDQAETVPLDHVGAALHGQGFARRDVRDNLVLGFPPPLPGYVNIGVLHTAVEGQEGHDPYAPCRLADLLDRGYDYWALGHIHQRQVLHREPYVVYSGNLQGRHVREAGDKGAVLVTVAGFHVVDVQFVELDVLRWVVCRVDARDVASADNLLDRVAGIGYEHASASPDLPLVARVVLDGETPLHGTLWADPDRWRTEVASSLQAAAPGRLWVESVKLETRPPRAQSQEGGGDALAQVRLTAERLRHDPAFLDEVLRDFQSPRRQMPAYFEREDALRVDSPESVRRLMEDAEALLRAVWFPGEEKA